MANVDRSIGSYHDSSHARIRKIGRLVGPASYATGGDPVPASTFGLGKIEIVLFEEFSNGSVVIHGLYLPATGRLKFFTAAGAEQANLADLSTYSARFEAIGY